MMVNNVYYNIEVSGNGDPLVLLHGFTGSTKSWQYVAHMLSSHFQIICIDLLGHGKTSSPPDPTRYSIANAANDLVDIFRALDVLPVNLLGYSMGGRLALYIGIHHFEVIKSLTLESSSPGLKNPQEREKRIEHDAAIAQLIQNYGIKEFVKFWESIPLWDSQKSLPSKIIRDLHNQRLQNNSLGLINSLIGMGTGSQPSLWSVLHNINFPVHLIVGELDKKFLSIGQEMKTLIANSQLSMIPSAGHTVHLQNPAEFVEAVLQALVY